MQTLSTTRPFRKRPRQASRCKGSEVEQTTSRSAGFVADGFLRHRFLPKYYGSIGTPAQSDVEDIYLNSLEHLNGYYGIETIDVSDCAYPYNVVLSQWDTTRKLKCKGRFRELKLAETENLEIQLSVCETINTGSTLYYIPLAQLDKALSQPENWCAKLLMGICVYLYKKAGVCHFRDSESYVCYLYEIMDDWIENDKGSMDDGDYEEQRSILDAMYALGDSMTVRLTDETYLLQMQDILKVFEPTNRFEAACLILAKETLAVWAKYPQANLYQHLSPPDIDDDEDDYYGNGKIRFNEYISFIGETSSVVYDTMITMANDDFNERSGVQDFEANIVFNKPCGAYADGLAYEEKVIGIITELCNLIEELP